MRTACVIWLWLCLVAIGSAAQRGGEGSVPGEAFIGTWSGSWEGAGGTGGFEITLEKNKAGAIAGRVSVTGEPAYKAEFKSVSFDGAKMKALYDFPASPDGEVALTATFDGNKATGTWSLREKASGNEVVTGTWTVARK